MSTFNAGLPPHEAGEILVLSVVDGELIKICSAGWTMSGLLAYKIGDGLETSVRITTTRSAISVVDVFKAAP